MQSKFSLNCFGNKFMLYNVNICTYLKIFLINIKLVPKSLLTIILMQTICYLKSQIESHKLKEVFFNP